jgi:Sec-independent protein translocase protein TatA
MTDSPIVFYSLAEIAFLLLVISIFLILNIRKLKATIRELESKLSKMRKAVSKAKQETKKVIKALADKNKIKPKEFIDYLDEEIEGTRDFHQTLNPDRDIVLDIAPDASLERQATSLRHAFLIAEKEARYAGGEDSSNWDVLQSKFQQIIQFYISVAPQAAPEKEPVLELKTAEEGTPDNAEEIAGYKKRIENLERFKNLFFEMEDKWSDTKKEADNYYQQLMAMGKDMGAGEDFDSLLNGYAGAFDDIGNLIMSGVDKTGASKGTDNIEMSGETGGPGKLVFANREEMQRLRNMAVDQHKIIEELKKKLTLSDSVEDKERVLVEMSSQVERQQRFLKEAEACTQIIEDELNRALEENQALRKNQENSGGTGSEEYARMETMVKDFTNESREMLGTIATLEDENVSLRKELDSIDFGSANGSAAPDTGVLQGKLDEMQQELLNLQTQHIELEERYLELKMK